MMHLSERLKEVATYVENGAILADIGSDHAYLPTYLARQGTIHHAICGEVVKGPYEAALKNVAQYNLSETITVRLANGLNAIKPNDKVTHITIAGMGGSLIAKILDEGKEKLVNVKRIITQPNIHAEAIREWAMENGWKIIAEKILKEDHKIYEIVVLERGQQQYTQKQRLLGPFLMQERNSIFREKWEREMNEWHRILQSLDAAQQANIQQKREQLVQQIKYVQEVLTI